MRESCVQVRGKKKEKIHRRIDETFYKKQTGDDMKTVQANDIKSVSLRKVISDVTKGRWFESRQFEKSNQHVNTIENVHAKKFSVYYPEFFFMILLNETLGDGQDKNKTFLQISSLDIEK